MKEKAKINENQIWAIVMFILPFVILLNAGNELTNDKGIRILYAGLFGGIGGTIGFVTNFLTKDKNRVLKISALIIIIAICGFTVFYMSSKPTDDDILKEKWVTQKIGDIEFDSPTKLKFQTSDIPESAKWFYTELSLYSDEKNDRTTSVLEAKITIDTLLAEEAFSITLEGMLKKMKVNLEEVELELFGVDDEQISSQFTFNLHGEKVNGYGFLYIKRNILESIWLLPINRGFSKEYIEEFEAGIFLD